MKNPKQQKELIKLFTPNTTFTPDSWDAQITTLTGLIAELNKELQQLELKNSSNIAWVQETENIEWFQEMAKQFFCAGIETLLGKSAEFTSAKEQHAALQSLLQEIEQEGLTEDRLSRLQYSVRRLDELTRVFKANTKDLQHTITDRLASLYKTHPKITKAVAVTMATVIGTAAVGPAGGLACKVAVEKLLANFEPSTALDTRSERIGAAIFQTVGSLIAGGKTAAAVAGGSAILKEAAPEEVQKAVEAGAFALVANKLGFSLPASIGAGMGATLLCRNLKIIEKIKKDLFDVKEAVLHTPTQAPMKFVKRAVVEIKSFTKGVTTSVAENKKCEAITRVAVFAFSALTIYFTLPKLCRKAKSCG